MTREFEDILHPLRKNVKVKSMRLFRQHGKTSTYKHCNDVAKTCYWINERFHLRSDKRTLLTAAMLHDFYLYDWHKRDDGSHRLHGFRHPKRAKENAVREFGVDENVQNAIDSHMWPMNVTKVPKSREAWILCLADKIVAVKETVRRK